MITLKRFFAHIAAALIPGAFVFGMMSVHATSARQKPPRRTWAPSGPIADILTPDDTDVTVLNRSVRPDSIAPEKDLAGVVNAFLASGDSALLVMMGQGQSELTSERNWIHTHWQGEITQVLRLAPGDDFAAGGDFLFDRGTGDLKLGKTAVHARLDWLREMVPGSQYLVFALVNKSTRQLIQSTNGLLSTYRVRSDGTLEDSEVPSSTPGPVESRTLVEATDLIRSWVAQHGG